MFFQTTNHWHLQTQPSIARLSLVCWFASFLFLTGCNRSHETTSPPTAPQERIWTSLADDLEATPLPNRQKTSNAHLFQSIPVKDSGLDFADQWQPSQDYEFEIYNSLPGGGICVGDIDGDDLPDVFLTQANVGSRLYRNLGHLKFEDITETSGVSNTDTGQGAAFVDVDNDGDLDLMVCHDETANQLYINDGKGRFTEEAAQRGLDFVGNSVMMAFADYDGDGVNDILVGAGRGSDLRAHAYDSSGAVLQSFQYTAAGNDGYIRPCQTLEDKILVSFTTGYGRYPRGPAAYDKVTGQILWHYSMGPNPGGFGTAVTDVNGETRILMNALTHHNGATGDGWNHNGTPTTDGDLYAIQVDEYGNEVFTRDFSADGERDGHVRTAFSDLDGDGAKEALVFEGHFGSVYRGTAQIHLHDTETGAVLKTYDGPEDTDWDGRIVGDLDGDGLQEILGSAAQTSGTASGYWSFEQRLLDSHLEEVAVGHVSGIACAAVDLDADGTAELLFRDGSLVRVTTLQFQELWTWPAPGVVRQVIPADLDADGIVDICVQYEGGVAVLTAIPEPTTLSLLAFGGLTVLSRRRKH